MYVSVEIYIDDDEYSAWRLDNATYLPPEDADSIERYLDSQGIGGTLINIL